MILSRLLGLNDDRDRNGDSLARDAEELNSASSLSTRDEFVRTIRDACWRFEGEVFVLEAFLPAETIVQCLYVIDLERKIANVEPNVNATTLHRIERTITDYLPNLVRAYHRAVASGASPDTSELTKNISVMIESLQEVLEAVRNDNTLNLEAQGMFLETRFGGSDLE